MTEPKVFISYSHLDREWAQQLAENMTKKGVNVWFDVWDVKPGQPWPAQWEKALRHSDVIILLINSENVQRPNLFFELGAAFGMGKTVIPVVPRDFEPHRLPAPLKHIQYLVRESPEETAAELADSIKALHGEAV